MNHNGKGTMHKAQYIYQTVHVIYAIFIFCRFSNQIGKNWILDYDIGITNAVTKLSLQHMLFFFLVKIFFSHAFFLS